MKSYEETAELSRYEIEQKILRMMRAGVLYFDRIVKKKRCKRTPPRLRLKKQNRLKKQRQAYHLTQG